MHQTMPISRLRLWDEGTHRYVADPGAWRLTAGPASDDAKLETKLEVTQ